MYLHPVEMIFWMDILYMVPHPSNTEMSRPRQFHMSRPQRNVFLIMMLRLLFFKFSLDMILGVLLSNLMIKVIWQ